MNEADFATQVYDLLSRFQWRWTHFRPALTGKGWRTPLQGHAGFPDIIAIRGGRFLVLELKGDGGKVTAEQQEWLDLFRAGSAEVHVWWPDDPGLEAMVKILC